MTEFERLLCLTYRQRDWETDVKTLRKIRFFRSVLPASGGILWMYKDIQSPCLGNNFLWEGIRPGLKALGRKRKNDVARSRWLKRSRLLVKLPVKFLIKIKTKYFRVLWIDIIGMRNHLIHAYFDVDLDVVWNTVTHDLPFLVTELEKIIPSENDS